MAPSQLGIFTRSDAHQERANIQFHVQPLSLDKFGDPLHRFPAITVAACNSTQLFQSLTSFRIEPASPADCIAGERPSNTGDERTCHLDKPCFPPGRRYLYSNWGYYTLGPLLAHHAGYTGQRNYNDLLRDKLLVPYGMAQTFGADEDAPPKTTKAPEWGCSFSYPPPPLTGRYLICPEQPHTGANSGSPGFQQHGSGHLWSTGPDMLKFLRFAMGKAPIHGDRRTAKAMVDARKLLFCDRDDATENDDGTVGKIGLGWNHNKIGAFSATPADLLWWKAGGAGAFKAYIGFSQRKNVGVFVLTNTDADEPVEIGKTFLGYY